MIIIIKKSVLVHVVKIYLQCRSSFKSLYFTNSTTPQSTYLNIDRQFEVNRNKNNLKNLLSMGDR